MQHFGFMFPLLTHVAMLIVVGLVPFEVRLMIMKIRWGNRCV